MLIPCLIMLFCLFGCMTDMVLGEKAKHKYSSQSYEVRNSFGKHKHKPNNRYRIDWRYANGSASHYGKKFHGRKAASMVIFDENQITAAHPNAVLPSIAKITRKDNGHSIYVIITDRGPFAKNRICDLSTAAAKKLGFYKEGHTKVNIQILEKESKILAKHWKKFKNKKLPNELFRYITSANKLEGYLMRV